jgi:hypothetical protein
MSSGTLASTTLNLCQLLGREEAACRSLLETVQDERAAIRTLAITEFHSINCKRLAILESLQTLAQERDLLVQAMAQLHGLARTTTIHALIDRLTVQGSADLRERYNSFMSIAKMVRAEIKHNVVLIEGIRGVVDKALSSGTKIVPGLDLYKNDGHSSAMPPINALFHQQG